MKLVRVLVLVIALVAGGVAAYLALNMGGESAPVVEAPQAVPSQDVLVATVDINQGQKLSVENIRWQAWPDDAMNPGYITRQQMADAMDTLKGSVVRSQFVAGEPIRQGKLARPESGYLSAILPQGKRAVAVRVSADTTAGGFILPNDRVDVVKTVTQSNGTGANAASETISSTILTNIKVLAIDQTVEDQKSAQSPEAATETVVVGKTATLELDPAQVELIASAESSGTLSLALRSMADSDEASKATAENRPSGNVRVFRFGRSQTVTTR